MISISGCSSPSAPISYREQPISEKLNHHTISSGETLYSIAWRYEIDPRALAKINNIQITDKIYVGQQLSLDTSKSSAKPYENRLTVQENSIPYISSDNVKWQWPIKGKVLKEFNSTKLFKGINIASNYGSTVLSAAPGIVVYSGESLRGYGKLIIIQHGQSFLSAYAHNKEVFVKADDTVKTNQKISETGYVGLKNQYLYFEIRKKGKPVNPLIYLPKAD